MAKNSSKICTCITASGEATAKEQVLHHARVTQIFELRLDFWSELTGLSDFLDWFLMNCDQELILTLRADRDGGWWQDEAETQRLDALSQVVEGVPDALVDRVWMDFEDWSPLLQRLRDLLRRAADRGIGIIRSIHDFSSVPDDLLQKLSSMQADSFDAGARRCMVKAAVMPKHLADTARLFAFSREIQAGKSESNSGGVTVPHILLGMGEAGFSTRVLAARMGSVLSYTSARPVANEKALPAAPGQIGPEVLEELYGFSRLTGDETVFGIIGNPVGHSKSPEYHNQKFIEQGVQAVYVPFLVDDLDDFFVLADELGILGLSVTVPHKQLVIPRLSAFDESVRAIGACNTVIRKADGWWGTNTDVPGFLAPIGSLLGQSIHRALVIGAGGAARACIYALLSKGIDVTVVNRTHQRAVQVVEGLREFAPEGVSISVADDSDVSGFDLVVQSTSLGMSPRVTEDPLPNYPFTKNQVVYDIIYSPAKTRLLERAEGAGCRVINGWPMFIGQAAIQSRHFINRIPIRGKGDL